MITFKSTFRRLFQKGEHTFTRVISLATGLAFGLLLLSEVLYFYSYDGFYPDAHRIYVVHESFSTDPSSSKLESHHRVSGAIAPGLKSEVPGIEAATRLNPLGKNVFYTADLKSYEGEISLADEFLFEVLDRPVIHGNPEEILKSPMNCMVSTKVANELGGDVIGQEIELKQYPNRKLTIAGVFEALPENTNYPYDVLISMVSTPQFFSWDGTQNWLGNDRYYACVKLEGGVDAESLAPAVRKMQEKNQDIEMLEQEQPGLVFKYTFNKIGRIRAESGKDMIIILSTIAISVLFVSLMNYILLTLSVLINRAKTSAIYKTCGAGSGHLMRLIFSETLFLFLISIAGAVILIGVFKPLAEAQLGHSLSAAFNSYVVWPILAIITFLIVVTSYLPGRFFSQIPVVSGFRDFKQKKNKWKQALLSFQFIGASFILTVMVIVTLQYNNMRNADHGYQTKGIFYGSTTGMDGNKLSIVLNELRAMPEISTVGLGYGVPHNGASGNNVFSLDEKRDLFNVADFYFIDEHYLSILNVQVKEGEGFSSNRAVSNDLLISQKGADLLKLNNGWTDGVVGRQIPISEHGTTTIRGVFPDFVINSIADPDLRPAVFFYLPEEKFEQRKMEDASMTFNILVKTKVGTHPDILKKMTDVFNLAMPQKDAEIKSLELELQDKYASERGFRNAMMAGNVVILLITTIGLIGYTTNEATRRRKELAIRKINGAQLSDILRSFIIDMEFVVIPAVLLGLAGAWLIANRWMQHFSARIPLSWTIFFLCSFFIILLVGTIAILSYTRTANKNPVEALKYE
jgi:putative ABC transport system permease protein